MCSQPTRGRANPQVECSLKIHRRNTSRFGIGLSACLCRGGQADHESHDVPLGSYNPFTSEGGGSSGNAAQSLENMNGKTRSQADGILKGKGFQYKGRTEGGYEKYYHPDGSQVQIRPNGEITRSAPNAGGGYRPRVDQFGKVIPRSSPHSTGEILK